MARTTGQSIALLWRLKDDHDAIDDDDGKREKEREMGMEVSVHKHGGGLLLIGTHTLGTLFGRLGDILGCGNAKLDRHTYEVHANKTAKPHQVPAVRCTAVPGDPHDITDIAPAF